MMTEMVGRAGRALVFSPISLRVRLRDDTRNERNLSTGDDAISNRRALGMGDREQQGERCILKEMSILFVHFLRFLFVLIWMHKGENHMVHCIVLFIYLFIYLLLSFIRRTLYSFNYEFLRRLVLPLLHHSRCIASEIPYHTTCDCESESVSEWSCPSVALPPSMMR